MPDMPKTLLITHFFPPESGGIQGNLAFILSGLPASQIVVLAPLGRDVKAAKAFDQAQPYTVVRTPYPLAGFSWGGLITLLSRVKKLVAEEHITQIWLGHFSIAGAGYVARRLGLPYMIQVHGTDLLMPQTRLRSHLLMPWILGGAKRLVANSQFTVDLLTALSVSDAKTTIVYPAYDARRFYVMPKARTLAAKKQFGLEGKRVLLSTGRLVQRKGHEHVLAVLPELQKKFPDLVYVIAGTGPYEDVLKARAEKHSDVRFMGRMSDDDMLAVTNVCDVFVLPGFASTNQADVEGFGIAFVEAAACGKPVVAGNNGGAPEAVLDKQTGLVVADKTELQQAITLLLQDTDLATRMGGQARVRAEKLFSATTQSQGYLQELRNLSKN